MHAHGRINSDALHSGARKKMEKGTTSDCIKKPQRASTMKQILSQAPGTKTQHVRAQHICRH
jgi:hypothetical protein